MNVHSSLIHTPKWKQPRCPSTSEWLNKLWYIHTVEYQSTVKRNKLLLHTTRMNLKGIMLSKKKPIPKGYIPYDSIYITFLK